MQKFICTINTNGRGYWSNQARAVAVKGWRIGYIDEEATFGELCVYFDTDTWDVDKHGLIYTDEQFIDELRGNLMLAGFSRADVNDIGYSEQGMQGNNYVSLDVGKQFISAVRTLYPQYWEEVTAQWA